MAISAKRRLKRWWRAYRKAVVVGIFTLSATLGAVFMLSLVSNTRLAAPAPGPASADGGLGVFGWTPQEQEAFARSGPAERQQMTEDRQARGGPPPAP